MGTIKEEVKRKASEAPDAPSPAKKIKASSSPSEAASPVKTNPARIETLPEKPAVVEERQGVIEFRVVNNDGSPEATMIMTGLKNIFQKQLPKMPKDYIARLVYDRTHVSMAIVKPTRDVDGNKLENGGLEVVGGITYRPFITRGFAEIVFCAISSDQQVKGYGAHLMSHLKDYVKASTMSPTPNPHPDNHHSNRPEGRIMHFLTYADNYAIGYFKKQGFTKEITLERPRWMGYIKDYEGGTIMQCSMVPRISYLQSSRLLAKQKALIHAKIERVSSSHIVHEPPKAWRNGVEPIDPLTIPAIKASGWSPDMDALSRAPRHGPNYNALLHLLNDLQNNTNAWPFQQPVNKDEVLDYYDVIKEPMDLSTMESKLEKDQYPQVDDFIKDALLIVRNCRKYNSEGTPYAKAANRLEKFLWGKIREVPEWSHLEPESFKPE